MTATRTIATVLFLVLLASLLAGCANPAPAEEPTTSRTMASQTAESQTAESQAPGSQSTAPRPPAKKSTASQQDPPPPEDSSGQGETASTKVGTDRNGSAWVLVGGIGWYNEEYSGRNSYVFSADFSIKDGRVVGDRKGQSILHHQGDCIEAVTWGPVSVSGVWDEFEDVFYFDPIPSNSGEEEIDIIRDDVFKKKGCSIGKGLGESMSMLLSATTLMQNMNDPDYVNGTVRVKAEDGATTKLTLNEGTLEFTLWKNTGPGFVPPRWRWGD